METRGINSSINLLVHDIDVYLNISSSYADLMIYSIIKNETVQAFSPEYLKFLLGDRRKALISRAVHRFNGMEEVRLTDEIYKDFNFIEIALLVDLFPNLHAVSFTTDEIDDGEDAVMSFSDETNPSFYSAIRLNAFGVRLREWFDERTVDEMNKQICIHNDKFNNAMHKDSLMLINEMSGLLDVCATVYSSMGKTVGNSTMPLFDIVPKSLMNVPVFVFTDYLER